MLRLLYNLKTRKELTHQAHECVLHAILSCDILLNKYYTTKQNYTVAFTLKNY